MAQIKDIKTPFFSLSTRQQELLIEKIRHDRLILKRKSRTTGRREIDLGDLTASKRVEKPSKVLSKKEILLQRLELLKRMDMIHGIDANSKNK